MTVFKDVVESQTLRRDVDGLEVERTFVLSNVRGNAENRLYNAMIASGIPQYGEPHPTIPDVQVTNVRVDPLDSGSQVRVICLYSVPTDDEKQETEGDDAPGTLALNTGVVNKETFFDINDEPLLVFYQGSLAGLGVGTRRHASADVQRPQMSVTFTRLESSVPKQRIDQFLGTVNKLPWSGFKAKTWLCSAIDVREEKNKFQVDYSFAYDPETWRVQVVTRLNELEAADTPIDVESGNGFARYDVYRSEDFNLLGLDF